jgi:hypothetical protein
MPNSSSDDYTPSLVDARDRFGSGKPPGPPLQPPNGGGGLEARVAKLEAAIEHIHRDVGDIKVEIRTLRSDARFDYRTLFGALIIVALGLAGLMARGFKWL